MSSIVEKRAAAREVIDILCEISTILVTSHFPGPLQPSHNSNVFGAQNTHLDRQTLSICVSLIENGVNPEALATVIQEFRKNGGNAPKGSQRESGESG